MKSLKPIISLGILVSTWPLFAQCIPPGNQPRVVHVLKYITVCDETAKEVCQAIIDHYPVDLLSKLNLPKACIPDDEISEYHLDEGVMDYIPGTNDEGAVADETDREFVASDKDSISVKVISWDVALRGISDPVIASRRSPQDVWRQVSSRETFFASDLTTCGVMWDDSVCQIILDNQFADDRWVLHTLDGALTLFARGNTVILDLKAYDRGSLRTMAEIAGRFISAPSREIKIRRRIACTNRMEEKSFRADPSTGQHFHGRLIVILNHRWPLYALTHFLSARPNTDFIIWDDQDTGLALEPERVQVTDSLELLIPTAEIESFADETRPNALHILQSDRQSSEDEENLIYQLLGIPQSSFEEEANSQSKVAHWPWTYHVNEQQPSQRPSY